MKEKNREIINYLFQGWSKGKAIDYVKGLYIAYMGSSHYHETEEGILSAFEKEKVKLKATQEDLFLERIGEKFVRVYISKVIQKEFSFRTFIRLFILSRDKFKGSLEDFKEALDDLLEAAEESYIPIDAEELKVFLSDYAVSGYPPVRHSDSYKRMYNPHYLVVSKEIADVLPLYNAIDIALLEGKDVNKVLSAAPKKQKDFVLSYWDAVYPEITL